MDVKKKGYLQVKKKVIYKFLLNSWIVMKFALRAEECQANSVPIKDTLQTLEHGNLGFKSESGYRIHEWLFL